MKRIPVLIACIGAFVLAVITVPSLVRPVDAQKRHIIVPAPEPSVPMSSASPAYSAFLESVNAAPGLTPHAQFAFFAPQPVDVTFTTLTAWSEIPSSGCNTLFLVRDLDRGIDSETLFLGANTGPSGSSQVLNDPFTVVAGHHFGFFGFSDTACQQLGGRINFNAYYQ